MKIAYFDCFAGIAGDMTLAALLDCGAPLEELVKDLQTLPLEGWNLEAHNVLRSGIHAKSIEISLHGETDEAELARIRQHEEEHRRAHEHNHEHGHAHSHAHEHDHHHEHAHSHSHAHEHHHHGRSMREIRGIILASGLSEKTKATALQIFGKIAEAEAYLHHSTPDDIHFHEIGGVDSIVDIVGVAWCLEFLGIERVYASPVPASSGFVDCAHGQMPIPAPATLEMLKGATWVSTDIRGEMVTPTGAGILAALAHSYGPMPSLKLEKIGSGAGKKTWPDRPNMLRISVGELAPSGAISEIAGLEKQTLALLETNVDDMNPQIFEAIFERLFALGALDVWTAPIVMKKSRPAFTLSVLCEQSAAQNVLAAILTETTTLGVRVQNVERFALERESGTISTPWGQVRIKTARWSEKSFVRHAPEWDDVLHLSRKSGVPAQEIYTCALQSAQNAAAVR